MSSQMGCPSYAQCEHAWSYIGKIAVLTRSLLNAAAKTESIVHRLGDKFPVFVSQITIRLKLLSLVSIPFSLVDLKGMIEKTAKALYDREWSTGTTTMLSISIVVCDIFDSTMTFLNNSLTLLGRVPFQFNAPLDFPLAFYMSGMGICTRSIQIFKTYRVFQKVDEENLKNPDTVTVIKQTVGIPQEKDLPAIDKISDLFYRKIKLDLAGIAANSLTITALRMFVMGTYTAFPFLLIASSMAVRLGVIAYQDYMKAVEN
jgi:hypothetical protein